MRRSILPFTITAFVLVGCPPPKESETSATTGSQDDTEGHSSAKPTGSANTGSDDTIGTSAPPDPTSGPDMTTGTVSGPTTDTTGTSDATSTTTTTTGAECMIELPDPGSCNKLKGGGDLEAIGASTGCAFICPDDLGGGPECDIFEQNCPEGQKCNAWSSDGDSSWDSTKCVPLDPNPDPVGAPCTVEGSGVSGIDSCVKGAMCWNIDPQTGEGTCVEQCSCSIDNPICTTPNTTCIVSNDASLVLCLPVCDPLDPGSCPASEVCVSQPSGELFICVVDASGDAGQAGDACEFINACDPAHTCVTPELFPACDQAAVGCCVPYCDLSAVDCPQGTSCLPWYEQGQAPKCFENVGVCGLEP